MASVLHGSARTTPRVRAELQALKESCRAITTGRKSDAPQASALIDELLADIGTTDTAYDSNALRRAIADKGTAAAIPNDPSRKLNHQLDKHL